VDEERRRSARSSIGDEDGGWDSVLMSIGDEDGGRDWALIRYG